MDVVARVIIDAHKSAGMEAAGSSVLIFVGLLVSAESGCLIVGRLNMVVISPRAYCQPDIE